MNKKIILILLSILMINSVLAIDNCEDGIKQNIPCKMFTPTLNTCETYNYTIYDQSQVYTTSTMSLFSEKIYTFNLTLPLGQYILTLCDGTYRELFVSKHSFSDSIINSWEVLEMLSVIIFWLGIMAISFWLLMKQNKLYGFIMMFLSIGVDFLLMGELYDKYYTTASGISNNIKVIGLFLIISLILIVKFGFLTKLAMQNPFEEKF